MKYKIRKIFLDTIHASVGQPENTNRRRDTTARHSNVINNFDFTIIMYNIALAQVP